MEIASTAPARRPRGEVRREFMNRRLGTLRKLPRVAARYGEFRARRAAAAALPAGLPGSESLAGEAWARVDLPGDLLAGLRREAAPRLRELDMPLGEAQEGKTFYRDLLGPEGSRPGSPWMAAALDERLLGTVAAYFGAAAWLQSVELIQSLPSCDARLFRSQLWHCDNNNDTRMLKLFVYLSDVGEENGPLAFLPLSATGRVPWTAGHYLADETIGRFTPLEETIRFTGPAGSAAMVDTARLFHFGSRCRSPRLTFVVHYNTGFGFLPRTDWSPGWAGERSRLSALQRLALGI